MSKMKNISDLKDVQMKSCTKFAKNSKEPNDGYFIEKDPNDSFSSEGTVRYGEEQDVERYVQNDEQQLEGSKLDGALLLT